MIDPDVRSGWLSRANRDAAERAADFFRDLPDMRQALLEVVWAYDAGTSWRRFEDRAKHYEGPERRRQGEVAA